MTTIKCPSKGMIGNRQQRRITCLWHPPPPSKGNGGGSARERKRSEIPAFVLSPHRRCFSLPQWESKGKGASFPSTAVGKNGFLEIESADMNPADGIRCRYRLLAREPPFFPSNPFSPIPLIAVNQQEEFPLARSPNVDRPLLSSSKDWTLGSQQQVGG